MVNTLKRHPIAVKAFFRHSLVLTYAVPRQVVEPMLPPGLTPDCHGEWAFIAAAMVQTERLRPVGFPGWLGQSFFLTGYRIFTRFHTDGGKTLRGLKVIRSDTDRRSMQVLGNAFTHYAYRKVNADIVASPDALSVRVVSQDGSSNVSVIAHLNREGLPEGSVFANAKEARRFAGPMPFTFDYEPETESMVVVEGVRKEWNPRLIQVDVSELSFLNQPPLDEARPILSSAFYLHDVNYRWRPGTIMKVGDRSSNLPLLDPLVS
jgi:hypothetical protein